MSNKDDSKVTEPAQEPSSRRLRSANHRAIAKHLEGLAVETSEQKVLRFLRQMNPPSAEHENKRPATGGQDGPDAKKKK